MYKNKVFFENFKVRKKTFLQQFIENMIDDTLESKNKKYEFEYDEKTGKIEGESVYMVKGKNGDLFPVSEENLNNIDEENFEYKAGVFFGNILTYRIRKNPHNLNENVLMEFIKLSKENKNYLIDNYLQELKKCKNEKDFVTLLFFKI